MVSTCVRIYVTICLVTASSLKAPPTSCTSRLSYICSPVSLYGFRLDSSIHVMLPYKSSEIQFNFKTPLTFAPDMGSFTFTVVNSFRVSLKSSEDWNPARAFDSVAIPEGFSVDPSLSYKIDLLFFLRIFSPETSSSSFSSGTTRCTIVRSPE